MKLFSSWSNLNLRFITHHGRYVWISSHCHANPLQSTLEQEAVGKSPVGHNYNVMLKWFERVTLLTSYSITMTKFYQWRENFFSCTARNRETPMSACITGSQNFAKVVCRLFICSSQLCRMICLLLLILKSWP